MKKVLTFLFAFAVIGSVAFAQGNIDYSEKVDAIVKELDAVADLTEVQEEAASEILTEALTDIASKRSTVKTKEAGDDYMDYRTDRWTQAFTELKEHVSVEQSEKIEQFAADNGLIKKGNE